MSKNNLKRNSVKCLVCGSQLSSKIKINQNESTIHPWNVLHLCTNHASENAKLGTAVFAMKYSPVMEFLESQGWEVTSTMGCNKKIYYLARKLV